MTKDEFITLIKVAEAVIKIDQACRSLTNFGLDEGSCNDTSRYALGRKLPDITHNQDSFSPDGINLS